MKANLNSVKKFVHKHRFAIGVVTGVTASATAFSLYHQNKVLLEVTAEDARRLTEKPCHAAVETKFGTMYVQMKAND